MQASAATTISVMPSDETAADRRLVAVSVFLFFSASDDELFSREAQRACDGPWGHMGIGFTLANGERVYFEALLTRGFTGPRPYADLVKWSIRKHHRLAVVELPTRLIINAQAMYEDCIAMTLKWSGRKGYHAWQLARMWTFQRYGLSIREDAGRVVCSEAVSRILAGFSVIDLRDRRRKTHDEVSPVSAWRRILAYLQGWESVDAPVCQ